MDKRGLSYAIDYLKGVYPTGMIPDDVYHQAGITGLVSSLAHSLRRAARGGKGKVLVTYHPDNSGHNVAYYRFNPHYKAPDRPRSTGKAPPQAFYWYTLKSVPIASPMFHSLEALKRDIHYTDGCRIWTGTHEAPILVGVVK